MTRTEGIGSIPGFTVRNNIVPQVPLTISVQQAVALMMGYAYGQAVVLRSSPSGVLYVAEPRIVDVFHWTAAGANAPFQGEDIACTQVLCIGHPDNAGMVWVAARRAAATTDSIPLAKNVTFTFSVENLNELHALIVTATEKLIVAYSL
jgi:hypothetical protein